MSAGEGEIVGGFLGTAYRLKVRILYPRAIHLEGKLQGLSRKGGHESADENVIRLVLVDTPEQNQRQHEKQYVLAEPGDQLEESVTDGRAKLFQKIEKFHKMILWV